MKSCIQRGHLCPGPPDCRGWFSPVNRARSLIHQELPWGGTVNSHPMTGLQPLFQILFNWQNRSLSSSQRTRVTPPQVQPSMSNLCAFAKAIPLVFSSWPLYPKFTYSAGASSSAWSFKSSYIIDLISFRYKARKEWLLAWTDEQMISSPGVMFHSFSLSIASITVVIVYQRLVAISFQFRKHWVLHITKLMPSRVGNTTVVKNQPSPSP